jgi:hypothetical protein
VIRFLRKVGRFLLYGGFGGPKPYESRVLEATLAALGGADAETFEAQMKLIERMQRWNEDRMVILGFEDKSSVPRLTIASPNHCLAKVRLKGAFGSIPAAVVTHHGILSSLEFRTSPRVIRDNGFSVEITQLHATDAGIASAIDEEEHDTAT